MVNMVEFAGVGSREREFEWARRFTRAGARGEDDNGEWPGIGAVRRLGGSGIGARGTPPPWYHLPGRSSPDRSVSESRAVTTAQPTTSFHTRLVSLKGELVAQGRLVQRSIEDAVEAVFERRPGKAAEVIQRDHEIDRVDVQIEKGAVQLLVDEWGNPGVAAQDLRMVLTIVKVNNEFERIGDLAAVIAEKYDAVGASGLSIPAKFRVMANSVIGIMHNTNAAFAQMDVTAARLVLTSDDATDAFKTAILRDIEDGLVKGLHTVDYAFALGRIAHSLARMADHCTNVAEQVIYVATGMIVRHQEDKWTTPLDPGA